MCMHISKWRIISHVSKHPSLAAASGEEGDLLGLTSSPYAYFKDAGGFWSHLARALGLEVEARALISPKQEVRRDELQMSVPQLNVSVQTSICASREISTKSRQR